MKCANLKRKNEGVTADVANAELTSIYQRVMAEAEARVEDASVRLGPLSEMRGLERGPAATTGRITLWLTALSYLLLGLICLIVGIIPAAIWITLAFAAIYWSVSEIKPENPPAAG